MDYKQILEQVTKELQDPETGVAVLSYNIFGGDRPMIHWSWMNQAIARMHGYTDARSFRAWMTVDRKVKKGEKAFYILKPHTFKIEDEGEKDKIGIRGFGGQPEFGYEQTEGEPLPQLEDFKASAFIDPGLKIVAERIGVTVDVGFSGHGEGGYYLPTEKKIYVTSNGPEVFYHELAHAIDHHLGFLKVEKIEKERRMDECVAEYSSAVLARYFNPESQIEKSKGYMTGWKTKDLITDMNKVYDRVKAIVSFIMDTAEVLSKAS